MIAQDIKEAVLPIATIGAVAAILYVVYAKVSVDKQASSIQNAATTQANQDTAIANTILQQGQLGQLLSVYGNTNSTGGTPETTAQIEAAQTTAATLTLASLGTIL